MGTASGWLAAAAATAWCRVCAAHLKADEVAGSLVGAAADELKAGEIEGKSLGTAVGGRLNRVSAIGP